MESSWWGVTGIKINCKPKRGVKISAALTALRIPTGAGLGEFGCIIVKITLRMFIRTTAKQNTKLSGCVGWGRRVVIWGKIWPLPRPTLIYPKQIFSFVIESKKSLVNGLIKLLCRLENSGLMVGVF